MMRSGWALLAILAVSGTMMTACASVGPSDTGGNMPAFTQADVAKLRFLEGRWAGTAPDGSVFYEEYDFPDDTTMRSRRFPDANFAASTDGSTVELKDGKLISTWGEYSWEAVSVADGRVEFHPVDAPSSFSWSQLDPDTVEVAQNWTDENGLDRRYVLSLNRIR